MRVLVIGFPLPDPQIDNYSFASAPSFFDYDAMVVDPASVSQVIEDVAQGRAERATHFDQPIVNELTSPAAVGLADLLHRRQEETARLLARGGLVACFAYPDVPHPSVVGFSGCHRYYWLPAPSGLDYGPGLLAPGDGSDVLPTESDHPFAPYVDEFRKKLAYRAHFVETAKGFPTFGRVFARSVGGAAVGVELRAGGGRVVFLPAIRSPGRGTERYPIARTILDCVRRSLDVTAAEPAPPWLAAFPLPGLAELETAETEAGERLSRAEEEVAAARARREEIDRYRRLLWQEGKYGLDAPVRDALRLLGLTVTDDLDQPAELSFEGQTALLEVEGAQDAVGMEPHYRLRKRWEETLARSGQAPRGLVVVNGYRLRPPEERPTQYVDALRVAAESMSYGILTADRLFEIVRRGLDADEAAVVAFRARLLGAEGEVTLNESSNARVETSGA
jgi:hypothetical protein